MPVHDAKLAYFRIEIAKRHAEELGADRPISPDSIREIVENGPFPLSQPETDEIIAELEHSFATTQKRGAAVKSDHRPWLGARRGEIEFYYWERLRRYYLEGNVLPPNVVATLDTVTDEILDYCGNPAVNEPWKRRGMVMGHVQSGKTTNYSSLICKAADAGYKIIILLAGITNSLRAQTQERLDETFIGRKSVFNAAAAEPLSILAYSSAGRRRFPAFGTTRDRDFSKAAANTYGVSLSSLNEPIIFVSKKNKANLAALKNWLKEQNHGQLISEPLLLIDDEADNASINTSADPDGTSAINRVIREILVLFERTSYVGYTATPFANIFIDPDTVDEMLEDDLFPKNFIKALDPPTNYVGAGRVFVDGEHLQKQMVRIVDDYVDALPLKHRREHVVISMPQSLERAIRIFCIARGIRILRGQGSKHCSMMINASRFNDVQDQILGLVYRYLQSLKSSIKINAGLSPSLARDPLWVTIREEFSEEFGRSEFNFDQVRSVLVEAVESIQATTINMRGGSLDYSRHKENGLHVIAIGGLALSRGLTLEGLVVSYILRNTATSDTLMQMARWFGYRPGYEDVCRLYLPKTSYDYYEFVNEAVEELRDEVKRMELLNLTPMEFGLKVRQSPEALKITAANKMRTASSVTLAGDYSGRHLEGFALYNNETVNKQNRELVEEFVRGLAISPTGSPSDTEGTSLVWRKVDGKTLYRAVSAFQFGGNEHLVPIQDSTSLFMDYFADRVGADLATWDVVLPYISVADKSDPFAVDFAGRRLGIRERQSGTVSGGNDEFFKVTGDKNRVADPKDARRLIDPEIVKAIVTENERRKESGERGLGDRGFCLQRERPLMIVHLFRTNGKAEGKLDKRLHLTDPVISLSFCLPKTTVEPVARTYKVGAVYRKLMEAAEQEPDDDEEGLLKGDPNV